MFADGSVTRHAESAVTTALLDTRVVVVLGARQVGKSTLIDQVVRAEQAHRRILTLDTQATRAAAQADPTDFISRIEGPVAIDEIQRVPELMTEIKLRVDRDQSPGQFLLTGSANLLAMSAVKESLAGRAEYLRLFPFSQGELSGISETFIASLTAGRFPRVNDAPIGRTAYAEMLVTGGFPAVQGRPANRRGRFFSSYLETVLERDITSVVDVSDRAGMARLLRALAARSGSELNVERLSSALGMPATTVRRHIDLFETVFLVRSLPPWSSNFLARAVKRPKLHIMDTGLLAALVGANARRVADDPNLAGMFFETFVAMELVRQASWLDNRPEVFHFRDRDRREVDIVLENADGTVTAVEVKASATIDQRDLHGLRHLRDKLGDRFAGGALIYAGADTVPFGDRLAAVPLSGLWAS